MKISFRQCSCHLTFIRSSIMGNITDMFQYFSDSNPQLIFTDSQNIIILDTETGEETIIAEGYENILYVDYHQSKNWIFWSDYYGNTISRYVN